MSVRVSCPSCGGPVVFNIASSIVAVCPYCRSVVARGDRKPEDLGKVAELVESESPLEVGLKGRYHAVPFELTGRAQFGHAAGGMWDEWYAAFADGRWGWLAEAQGRFYLTFQQAAGASHLPPFENLNAGQHFHQGQATFVIAETGEAKALAAEGEIPYRLTPGSTYSYADLSGPNAEFATLDYSETPPLLFVGHEAQLAELGFPESALRRQREPRQVEGLALNCPHCGGALALRAPDKTLRVTCPNCNSLLDVEQGQLRFLKVLTAPAIRPALPLGTVGKIEGLPFTVIGYMRRSVTVEGVRYPWMEYLLYQPERGFRWLVESDHHWSYVQAVAPGEVSDAGRHVRYHGHEFALFQKNTASVDFVAGEFYWKVEAGEHVLASDYIHPPEMLTREIADDGKSREINWSLGTYWPVTAVEATFGLKGLPRPVAGSVAPNQPFLHGKIYASWLILSLAAIGLGIGFLAGEPNRKVFEHTFALSPSEIQNGVATKFSDETFELKPRENLRVRAWSPVENSWVEVEGDLINEDTGLVQSFALPISYYHGVEGGESWSEGGQESDMYLSAMPAGMYTLRLEGQWEHMQAPISLRITILQGVPRLAHWFMAMAALAVIPACIAVYHLYFTLQRWKDSPFSPYHSKK